MKGWIEVGREREEKANSQNTSKVAGNYYEGNVWEKRSPAEWGKKN